MKSADMSDIIRRANQKFGGKRKWLKIAEYQS
jgi:hypothetical protein